MPGVPPDAVAQVKRGLRGLFSRKKRSQSDSPSPSTTTPPAPAQTQQPPTETHSPPQNPTITTTAPSPSPGQAAEEGNPASKKTTEDDFPPPPPGPPPGNNGMAPAPPQPSTPIPAPGGMQEAKIIDPDPSSSVPPITTASPPRPTDLKSTANPDTPPTAPPATHNGMSATSGPLDDSAMMFGEGRGAADADGSKFLARERGVEDALPKGEGAGDTIRA